MSAFHDNALMGASGQQGYKISRSVRLRSSATANFNRTFSTPTSNIKWTLSSWVKRGSIGSSVTSAFIGSSLGGASTYFMFSFNGDAFDILQVTSGSIVARLTTSSVYRDPSSWYHVVMVWDSGNATSSSRILLYVNGVQLTAFSTATYPSLNLACSFNASGTNVIGYRNYASDSYFDGYMTEINFIDGQALTPSSFGETDTTTGVWKPKKYTGTYGTNGFYLNFSDNSGATATTIGKDNSGNGNNWTPNNISVTAGVTYDSMTDVPTLTSATAANFATMNPLNQSGTATPTNGNLTVSQANNQSQVASTIGMSSGKWYYEHTITAVGGEQSVGIGTAVTTGIVGGSTAQWGYYSNGNKYTNSAGTAYGASYTTGDVIGVAYDADAGSLTFYKNGTSQGVAYTGLSGTMFALAATRTTGGTNISNLNFGQRPFSYTPPTGFVALNTQNLPAPTISNGAQYMAATLYTGNGSSQTVTNAVNGVSFTPDFVWNKGRSVAYNNNLVDVIRGNSNVLFSNTTDAEQNPGAQLDITTNGFISTYRSANLANNQSGATYVAWQWKAGGTAVSNTAGTITSSVSANPTAGFSVVTYTGTGANATVGHGLGVAPKMVIVKWRSSAGGSWATWHSSFVTASGTDYLLLDSTGAKGSAGSQLFWNNTAPTSSVFSIGTNAGLNTSTGTYVAYCFSEVAGYSKFGSYTGNGSADGPFVFLGFRPRFVIVKNSSSTGSWIMEDSARNTYNEVGNLINANTSGAEFTTSDIKFDFLSNGFKVRQVNSAVNGSGNTLVFMAFAENPFRNSLAR